MGESRVISGYMRVVVTGTLAYDQIMVMPGRFRDQIMPDKLHLLNVSFTMTELRRSFGGTGGNIAFGLARLGVETLLLGVAGSDFGSYKRHLKKLKFLDLAGVRTVDEELTPQGVVMTDKDDNQIWAFYEGAMKYASGIRLDSHLQRGDFLVVSVNERKAVMGYVAVALKAKIPYMFDPAFNISHFTKEELLRAIVGCRVLIGNDYEVELLRRRLGGLRLRREQVLVTTLGGAGSMVEWEGRREAVAAVRVEKTVDPTGAGDAYRAGFVAGWVRGESVVNCARWGSVVASYVVERYGTQTYKFGLRDIKRRYRQNFGGEIEW